MSLVIGIDAAWTENGTSGIALLEYTGSESRIVAVSSSYHSFISRDSGINHMRTSALDVPALLTAAGGRENIDLVAIDMPMARTAITGRREADQAVSRAFGAFGAAVHSPNQQRPGAFGKRVTEDFEDAGFHLVTTSLPRCPEPFLIEVFPLAALVRQIGERPRYKAGKTRKYWPGCSIDERIHFILESWRVILESLKGEISDIGLKLPERASIRSLADLKSYEDMLDAIICAWVGVLFLKNEAEAFGDESAAIWIPKSIRG